MMQSRLPIALMSCVFASLATPAFAFTGWGEGIAVLEEEELNSHRGGIAVSPTLEVNFGAMVTTYVNGAPALLTTLTWTETGTVSETIGQIGQNLSDLSPERRSALGADGLENAGGIVIEDEAGVTALIHNIADGSLQNIIYNTASGRDLRQDVNLTLTLPGFEAIQASIDLERLGIRINEDLRSVSFGR